MGNVLNVSFHPSEIGKQSDLFYIRFKCGARCELTQVARELQVSSILQERLAEQNRTQVHEYKRALRDRVRVCGKCGSFVRRALVAQRGASMRSVQRNGLCVQSSESENMHYTLISNESVGEIKCLR